MAGRDGKEVQEGKEDVINLGERALSLSPSYVVVPWFTLLDFLLYKVQRRIEGDDLEKRKTLQSLNLSTYFVLHHN